MILSVPLVSTTPNSKVKCLLPNLLIWKCIHSNSIPNGFSKLISLPLALVKDFLASTKEIPAWIKVFLLELPWIWSTVSLKHPRASLFCRGTYCLSSGGASHLRLFVAGRWNVSGRERIIDLFGSGESRCWVKTGDGLGWDVDEKRDIRGGYHLIRIWSYRSLRGSISPVWSRPRVSLWPQRVVESRKTRRRYPPIPLEFPHLPPPKLSTSFLCHSSFPSPVTNLLSLRLNIKASKTCWKYDTGFYGSSESLQGAPSTAHTGCRNSHNSSPINHTIHTPIARLFCSSVFIRIQERDPAGDKQALAFYTKLID